MALAFFVIMLISIAAAYLYGVFFVNAIAPDTSEPFYRQPFVWGVAAIAVALAALLTSLAQTLRSDRPGADQIRGRNQMLLGFNMLLWSTHVTEEHFPLFAKHQAGGLRRGRAADF